MRKVLYSFLIIICLFMVSGCEVKMNDDIYKKNKVEDSNDLRFLKMIINDNEYFINLEDNETVKSFVKILPKEYIFNDLNNNEKYVYLDDSLPISPVNINHINAGDVMLFGDNCLVVFYESFDTNYSYTKIGHIDGLPNLGNENISVKILKN